MQHKFFKLVPDNPNFPFIKYGKVFAGISVVLTIVCLFFLATRGLNYGVDFRGGSEIYLRFQSPKQIEDIRKILVPLGYGEAVVQSFGDVSKNEFIIKVQAEDLKLESLNQYFIDSLKGFSSDASKTRIRYSEDRFHVYFDQSVEVEAIRQALEKIPSPNIQIENVSRFGRSSDHEYAVQFLGASSRIVSALEASMGKADVEVLQIEEVGQKVGSELRKQAVGAVLISLVLILIYIWFRFDFEFAPGAIVALVHDVAVILGVFSIFRLPFDLSSIAAVLTVVGYSINDTIVTYDRVRENMKKVKSGTFSDLVNLSINETLGRTLLLSLTVLMATVILFFYGGPITQNFALALSIGVISGTYSTICLASPITLYLRKLQAKSFK